MTKAARAPAWFPPISLVGIVFVVALISFTPSFIAPSPLMPFRTSGQLLLLFMLLRALCCWPPMIRWVSSMPIPHRIVFAVLIGGMICGHYTLNGRTYFPFVSWEIFPFVHEDDPVTCREFIGTPNEGPKVRLLVEQLFPSIVQIDPLDALDDPSYYPPGTTEKLARALAKAYNERHPDNPVWRVELMELTVKLHPPSSESRAQPSCELLRRYEISSGQ